MLKGLVYLTLVCGAVAVIGHADALIFFVPVGEAEASSDRDLGTHDSVATKKIFLPAKHMH